MPRARGPAEAIETRRGEVERIHAAGAQYFKVSGEIQVIDPGETAIIVNFPVIFVDKPAFSFGPTLDDGQPIQIGSLPTCSVVVISWQERIRDDDTVLYVGAQFAIVTTGPENQVMLVQWHMEGIGLRGPVNED